MPAGRAVARFRIGAWVADAATGVPRLIANCVTDCRGEMQGGVHAAFGISHCRIVIQSPECPMRIHALLAGLGLVLAACQTSGPPPAPAPGQAPPGVTPSTFRMPTGTGCAGEVERFQAIMDNDLASGHTTKGVHGRVSAEIATARSTCAAGNEGGAIARVRATRTKFGYP
jgi:hypothetical protein